MRQHGQELVLLLVCRPQCSLAGFQRLLHALEFVDFRAGAHPAHDRARRIPHRQGAAQHPLVFAMAIAQAVFDLVRLARGQAVPPARPGRRLVFRMEHPVPRLPVGAAFRHAGEVVPALVVVVVEPVRQGRPDHLRNEVGDGAETRLAFTRRFQRRLAVGRVRALHEDRLHLPRGIHDRLVDEVGIDRPHPAAGIAQRHRQAVADEGIACVADLFQQFEEALPLQFRQRLAHRQPHHVATAHQLAVGGIGPFEHQLRTAQHRHEPRRLREQMAEEVVLRGQAQVVALDIRRARKHA